MPTFKKFKLDKKKGILFWVTGLSGSGKTTIAKKIKKRIIELYGPTLIISGDNIRKIFRFKKYSYADRLSLGKKCCKFAKFITDQRINLIFAAVGMMDSTRKWYRENINNYVEIYIKADVKKIIRLKKKKIYHLKKNNGIVGINIKPEFPKKPDIVINNDFRRSAQDLADNLIEKIVKL